MHTENTPQFRPTLAAAGAFCGLAFFLLFEHFDDVLPERYMFVFTMGLLSFAYFLLFLTGPLPMRQAAAPTALGTLAIMALSFLVSFRYEMSAPTDGFVAIICALALLVKVSTPFVIAALKGKGLFDYPTLFSESWGIFVRGVAAAIFAFIFFGLLRLSNALFQLIGLNILEYIFDSNLMMAVIWGGVFGLALAVAYELRAYVSPMLPLRLLRLLILPVLVIVTVFVIGVPLSGMQGLEGFSVAATLLAIAAVVAALVTTAVDMSRDDEVQSKLLREPARALAVLLFPITALALYALLIRVADYGLTPERVFGLIAVTLALFYGAIYAASAVQKGDWMARIRRANAVMALGLAGVCVLLMTPILHPERLAASNQFARYLSEKTDVVDVPLSELREKWGVAGVKVFERLEAQEDAALRERIANLKEFGAREEQKQTTYVALARMMTVLPEGRLAREDELRKLGQNNLNSIVAGCEMRTPDDNPGCFAIFAPNGDLTVLYLTIYGLNATPWYDTGARNTAEGAAIIDAAFAGEIMRKTRSVTDVYIGDNLIIKGK